MPPHSDPTCLKSQSLILHGVYLSIESTALHINLTGISQAINPSLSPYLLEKHATHPSTCLKTLHDAHLIHIVVHKTTH